MPLTLAALAIFFFLFLSLLIRSCSSFPISFYHTHSFAFDELASIFTSRITTHFTHVILYDLCTYVFFTILSRVSVMTLSFLVRDDFGYRSLDIILYNYLSFKCSRDITRFHRTYYSISFSHMSVEIKINSTADWFIFSTLALEAVISKWIFMN